MNGNRNNNPILSRLIDLYVSYRERYILCLRSGHIITAKRKDGRYCWLSDNVLKKHLEQEYAVGVFADKYGSRFICFDVDDGNPETVRSIITGLNCLGFQENDVHVSCSGGKGYHVEMFFDEIISSVRLQALYSHIIAAQCLDPHKVEFRPTHTSSIKLPLSVHARTGNICWYVDRKTLEPVMTAEYILGIRQINAGDALAMIPECAPVIAQLPSRQADLEEEYALSVTEDFAAMLTQEGTRHDIMRKMVSEMRAQGISREACRHTLEAWIQTQDARYYKSSPNEIRRDISGLISWGYSDHFVIPKVVSGDSTFLRTSMLEGLLAQKTRNPRKIYLLLLARCRMKRYQISQKDVGKAIGVSAPTAAKAVRILADGGYIEVTEGTRLNLGDGAFSAESRSYIVPHSIGNREELYITITMRELISDFNVCYYKVLHALVAQDVLKEKLTREEWDEYLEYLSYANGEVSDMETSRRIDLIGTKQTIWHKAYGGMDVYDLSDRLLYPAYDVGRKLNLANPSAMGSDCISRESWWIRVKRCMLKNGTPSYQVLRKNFIAAEDVRRLAQSSKDPRAAEICEWILSLESGKEHDGVEK